jgi:RNA polymerase sigma-70 factor (ECF subfamily)
MLTTEAIWEQFSQRLHGYISRRVSDRSDADDILQQVFLKVHQNLDSLQSDERLLPWLYRIARNALADFYRTHRSLAPLPESLAVVDADEPDPESELAHGLNEMLACLPEKYRHALELGEIQELKQQEVADRLGLSLSGAKSRLQRGRVMLRQALFECCHFEFDRRGGVIDYHSNCCPTCGGVNLSI